MSENVSSEGEVGTPNNVNEQEPDVDEVFSLVSDLGQLLLNWSWEGTLGLEDKIERVAGAYNQEIVSLVTAESAVVQMGSREAFLKALPGIPPLAALPGLKQLLIKIEGGKLRPDAARQVLKQVAETESVYSPLLRIIGVMMLSFGFAIDIVGTWEACVVAFLTGIISGIFLLQADKGLHWALGVPFLASFFITVAVTIAYQQGLVS